MALLDSLTNSGTIRVPSNAVRPIADPDSGSTDTPEAKSGVAKIPTPANQPYANGGSVMLPNRDDYEPIERHAKGPTVLDKLGRLIGIADARQFLKTYNFVRDPSKALYLANLAGELLLPGGILPKNRLPGNVSQEDDSYKSAAYWDSYTETGASKIAKKLRSAVDNLKATIKDPLGAAMSSIPGLPSAVSKDALIHEAYYGDGNTHHMRPSSVSSWDTAYSGFQGDGDIPSNGPKLRQAGFQKFGHGTLKNNFTGDNHKAAEHKRTDVFAQGYTNPYTAMGVIDVDPANDYSNEEIGTDNGLEASFNNNNPNIKPYTELSTPYGIKQHSTSQADTVRWAIETLGCSIGYRSWYGFTPGSNHTWDIQIYPYNGPSADGDNPNSPLPEEPTKFTVTPKLPSYTLPDLDGTGDRVFSFGKNCPVLSYTLQYGNQKSKDIPLYNGDQIHMPMGFSYEMIMSLSILDDVNGSFLNWITMYMNRLYDVNTGGVVRYDQGAVIIRLIVFKEAYMPKYEFRFIATPFNFSPQLEGESAPNETQISIDFHIIGMKNGYASNTVVDPVSEPRHQNDILAKTPWTDVVIAPRKLK